MPGGGLMARVGDITAGMGVLEPGPVPVIGILINGLPPATFGSVVTPHFPCSPYTPLCCEALVMDACQSVRVNGQPVTFVGAETTCGHPIMTGAAGVIIKGV